MALSFSNLFFVKKGMFPEEKQSEHEKHHRKTSWVFYSTMVLGFWLIANPPTFGYQVPVMRWSDIIAGFLMIVLSYFALKPYKLWASWGIIFLGLYLVSAPMILFPKESTAFLIDFLVGTLAITFAILIPGQPGIKLYAQPGPNVPPGWNYNPSSWMERIPVIFFAWVGFFVARYMGSYQLELIDTVWDPFFGEGTKKVLTSKVSKSFPVSDATLGAFSYLIDVLFAYAGGRHRWRTMPWVVIIFGILIVPLGVVSITLVILQPVSVGYWCTLCLTSAFISLIMIPFTLDEVLATTQLLIHEKRKGNSVWKTLWFGGTMEGGSLEDAEDPKTMLDKTGKIILRDLFNKPWNLFLIIAAGFWVTAAPKVLGYSEGAMANSNYVVGALIVTFAVISMSEVARPLRYIFILFGIWLIAAPFVIGTDNDAAMWSGIITGIILMPLSLPKGKIEEDRGGYDRYIK